MKIIEILKENEYDYTNIIDVINSDNFYHIDDILDIIFPNNEYKNEKQKRSFFSVEIDETGLLLSEDYYFCRKWREIGGDVWCAPWVKLTHWGTHPFFGKFISEEYA